MKNIYTIILVSCAGLGLSALVQAGSNEAKATWKLAETSADADYKVAREKCNSLADNAKDVCVEEAKAARTHVKSDAEAKYKNTARARANAIKSKAEADYAVAKTKCDSQSGNGKDVCIKEAKAVLAGAKADANATKEIVAVKAEARDEKNDANYKVALEKCDAQAGSAKDNCISVAKTHFGK